MIPLIGKKNQAEKLAKLNEQAGQEYQKEMSKKLSDWEIENNCMIQSLLVTNQTPSNMLFQSVLNFKKMNDDELNKYKIALNDEEAKELKV